MLVHILGFSIMFDLCVNFSSSALKSRRIEEILEQSRQAGLAGLCAVGTNLRASREAVALAEKHADFVFSSAGLHPHQARDWPADAQAFRQLLAAHPQTVCGECGLDYYRMLSSKAEQQRAFCEQLELARELDRPVLLHERDAFEDMLSIVREAGRGLRGVVHCFTGTSEQAQAYLDLGLDLGVTGWIADLRRAESLREAVLTIPLDRLHVETDAPFLLPRNMPKAAQKAAAGVNLPRYLPWVLEEVAHLLGQPADTVARQTTENSLRFLSLAKAGTSAHAAAR